MQTFPLNTCQLLKIALELIKQQSTVLLFRHHYQGGRGQQQGLVNVITAMFLMLRN